MILQKKGVGISKFHSGSKNLGLVLIIILLMLSIINAEIAIIDNC